MIATAWTEERLQRLRADPVAFAIHVLGFNGVSNSELTDDQTDLLYELGINTDKVKRVAVQGKRGTLKTTTSVIIALWRAFQSDKSVVVVTAPTWAQLKDIWRAECSKILQNSDPEFQKLVDNTAGFRVTGTGDAFGRILLKRATKPENFCGFHGPQVTFIVDEASGVDRDLFRPMEGSLSNTRDSLFLLMGSPDTRDCFFSDVFNDPKVSPYWVKETWTEIPAEAKK